MELSVGSRVAIFATAFFCRVSFSIVLWSICPYLSSFGSSFVFFVIVLYAYAAGEMVGAMIFRVFTGRFTVRRSMLMINTLGIVGASLYVLAPLFRGNLKSRASILVGRGVLGIWVGGGQSIQEAYLKENLTPSLLTPVIETLCAYESLGIVVGLVLGYAFSVFPRIGAFGLSVNETLVPGIFILLSLFVCFTLYAVAFNEEVGRPVTAAICSSTQAQAALQEELLPLTERRTDIATMMPSPSFEKEKDASVWNREFFRILFVLALRKMMCSYGGVGPPDQYGRSLKSAIINFVAQLYFMNMKSFMGWTRVTRCSIRWWANWSLLPAPVSMYGAQMPIVLRSQVAFLSVFLPIYFVVRYIICPLQQRCDQGKAHRIMFAVSVFWRSFGPFISAGVIFSTFDQGFPYLMYTFLMALLADM